MYRTYICICIIFNHAYALDFPMYMHCIYRLLVFPSANHELVRVGVQVIRVLRECHVRVVGRHYRKGDIRETFYADTVPLHVDVRDFR